MCMELTEAQLNNIYRITKTKLLTSNIVILLLLHHKRRMGKTIRWLRSTSGLSAASVCMAKEKLMSAGLVTEHFPTGDQRVTKLYLTKDGRRKSAAAWRMLSSLADTMDGIRTSMDEL